MKPILVTTLFSLLILTVTAQVRLPQLVSNGMVLQRNTKLKIWGWAANGEHVSVSFKGSTYKATASQNGDWAVMLPAMPAGGPFIMDISGSNHITLKDILIGDVWFCSGQSNMTIKMERVKEKYPDEIAKADFPDIRYFFVPAKSDVRKVYEDLPRGRWVTTTSGNIMDIGAVAYFFAKQIYTKYHVPIGLINSSVGGTPIQAWTSAEGLKQLPRYAARLDQLKDSVLLNQLMAVKQPPAKMLRDEALTGDKRWYDPAYVPVDWHPFWLPGYLADQGVSGFTGVAWFRKEVDVPAALAGKPAKLFMGTIVSADVTYVNGIPCGETSYQYPPRRYEVPAGVLKAGKNLLVVKVTMISPKGGFVPEKNYYLDIAGQHIDLRGDWQYKVGQVFDNRGVIGTTVFSAQNEPSGLYNAMVAPAINYKIKGFLWYQGEANSDSGNLPSDYAQLLPALINDWRTKWGQGNLPFFYVQLPNFMDVKYLPSESNWAIIREGQFKTLSIPETGMATTIDLGEWNDIHPLDKKDVGERLATAAENIAYGDKTHPASGPVYQTARIEGHKIVLTFGNIGGGLIVKGGGNLRQFAVAGADKKFVWADAVIAGATVVVSSPDIADPKFVRYAWADNPQGANLYNTDGLPASPFRTDDQ